MELIRIERHDQALNPELRKRAEHVRDSRITKVFVGREGGQEVAFVALDFHPPGELWLYDLLVPKDMRRLHVGSRVLQAVERLAKQFGYAAVYLHPKSLDKDFPDDELVKWYERCGYAKVDRYRDLSLSKSLSEKESGLSAFLFAARPWQPAPGSSHLSCSNCKSVVDRKGWALARLDAACPLADGMMLI